MKKTILMLAAVVALGWFGSALADQTETVSLAVGKSIEKTASVSGWGVQDTTWTQTVTGDGKVCNMTNFTTSEAKSKTVTFTGVGAGYTQWAIRKNGSWSTTTFTYNCTITDTKSGTIALHTVDKPSETVTCEYGGSKTAEWSTSSDNTLVATVTAGGGTDLTFSPTITAVGPGKATITVKNTYITYTYTVTVTKPPQLTIDGDALSSESHLSVVSVTTNGVAVAGKSGVYVLNQGADALVTFAAVSGYKIVGGNTMIVTMDGDQEITSTTVGLPTAIAGSKLPNEVEFTDDKLTTIIGYDGATVTTNEGDLVFTFSDTTKLSRFELMKPQLYDVEILAVGGGGAGGTQSKQANGAGGGGAGGYQDVLSSSFTAGMYYIAVGAGGRKADTKISSVYGNNGGNSVVTNGSGLVIASAVGGGGGGASLGDEKTGGQSGGSGGGGAWVAGKATAGGYGAGGTGRDGQGNNGGTPTYKYYGGGGGGASSAGGALGEAGEGEWNDITGTRVEYARGGEGGKDDTIAPAADANGPGFGGAGGNGGIGGAGGDGVVIIRVKAMYKNIQIQRPSVLNGGLRSECTTTNADSISEFVYKGGEPGTGKWFISPIYGAEVKDKNGDPILGANGKNLTYNDVTNYVQGVWTTNAWTELDHGTNVIKGIGHQQFTMHLKAGVSWVDDTDPDYGSSSGALIEWRITTDITIVDATISVEKLVEWSDDGSNATITVSAYATPKQNPITPKVLFLGSLCNAHGLTLETVTNSLNAVAGQAEMDYYFYGGYAVDTPKDPVVYGSMKCGDRLLQSKVKEISDALESNNHHSMAGFYSKLNTIFSDESLSNKYDYICMEFDGSRMAVDYGDYGRYTGYKSKFGITDTIENFVSKCMKGFYDRKRVIWIVDDVEKAGAVYFPYYPNPKYQIYSSYWSDFSDSDDECGGWTSYNGLVGLTSPDNYPLPANTFTICPSNSVQVGYTVSSTVENYLKQHIVPVAYDLTYSDQVKANVGLSITGVEFFVTTNNIEITADESEPWNGDWSGWWRIGNWVAETQTMDYSVGYDKWKDLTGTSFGEIDIEVTQVSATSNVVTLAMTDMMCETRGKIIIHVVDDGTFKTTADATWNPVTQEWEKDPNQGKANVVMSVDGQETTVKGSAATSAAWSFKTYWVTANAENGEEFLNGIYTNEMGFAEKYNPTVAYRGLPGYVINQLFIDANPTEITGSLSNSVVFLSIGADHDVQVVYSNYVRSVTATPTTNTYDGAGHVFKVTPEFIEGVTYETEIRYSMTKDGEYTNATAFCEINRATLKNVGDHTFYYKVYALQPGYGDELDAAGWVEIGRELVGEGQCTSTIVPKTLTMTADAQQISYNDDPPDYTVKFAGFVAGEDENTVLDLSGLTCTCSYKKGDSVGQYTITPSGAKNKEYDNYLIKPVDGELSVGKSAFVINNVPQGPSLNPDDPDINTGVPYVEKIYDGVGTSIVVNVTSPKNYTIRYSTNGTDWVSSDDQPLFTNVCEKVKVWYALESGDCFAFTNYQYVTIKPRPVTLKSGSATKMYDGAALECKTIGPVDGSLDFVESEKPGISMTTITRLTDVGSLGNNYEVTFDEQIAKSSNYLVTQEYGTLTVTRAPMVIGDPDDLTKQVTYPVDPDKAYRPDPGSNGVQNVTNVYSGAGNRITVNVVTPKTGYTVKYSSDGVNWYDDVAYTNVSESGRGIFFLVEDDKGNYTPVTNIAFVTILPKAAGITAASASKVYDGTPLTDDGFEATGFVAGEGVKTLKMTAASTIRNAGACANTIDVETVEPLEGTDFNNYSIGYTNGTLTVTKRPLVLVPTSQSAKYGEVTEITYDLSQVTGDNYVKGEVFTYSNAPTLTSPGKVLVTFGYADNGEALVSNYDVTIAEAWLTLGQGTIQIGGSDDPGSDPSGGNSGVKPVVAVYDGTGYALSVNVTYPSKDSSQKIRYATNYGDWGLTNPAMTNVTDGAVQVWYVVDVDGYASVTNYSWVTVTQRVVTVVADDKTMTYGGAKPTPLTAQIENKVSTDDFTVPLALTNAVFDAGTYPGAISTNGAITAVNGDGKSVTENYNITFVPGTLTIEPAEISVTVTPVEKEYDGTGTNITVVADAGFEVWYRVDGGEWTRELALTNVVLVGGKPGAYTVEYKVHDPAGNYADKTGTSTVTIQPRHVTVTVNSFDMYISEVRAGKDKEKYSATLTYDNGQTMKTEDEAKIKYVIGATGDMVVGDNEITATGETLQGNYTMTYVPGNLHIYDELTMLYVVHGATNCYDGVGHWITVEVTNMTTATYQYGPTAEGPWSDTAQTLAVTNVSTDGGTPIYFKITSNDSAYYSPVVAHAVEMVTQRVVAVRANDARKNKDAEDPALTATVSGMVPSEVSQQEELIKYTLTRDAGEEVGDYTIRATGAESQGNYSVRFVNGTFTILEAAKVPMQYDVKDVIEVYNGKGVKPSIKFGSEMENPRIEYLIDGEWTSQTPCYTNVVQTNITFAVYADNGIPATNSFWLVITKRVLELTTVNEMGPYDGFTYQGADPLIGGMQYAPGEKFDYVKTNITDVGFCEAWFDVVENEKTKLSNYEVIRNFGIFEVRANDTQIYVASESAIWQYDGQPHGAGVIVKNADLLKPGHWLDLHTNDLVKITEPGTVLNTFDVEIRDEHKEIVTGQYDNFLVATGMLKVVNAKFKESDIKATAFCGLYDGTGHSNDVEVIKKEGIDLSTVHVSYSKDGINWNGNPVYTNVVSTYVWYKVSATNHDEYVCTYPLSLEIQPRKVTFVSPSTVAWHDVTPKISTDIANITTNGDGMATGEWFKFTATNEFSAVDHQAPAEFDIDYANSCADASNYDISFEYGWLVMIRENKDTFGAVVATNCVFTYDGHEHKAPYYTFYPQEHADYIDAVRFTKASVITNIDESPVENKIGTITLAEHFPEGYGVTKVHGTLSMTKGIIPDPVVTSTNLIYDGVGHAISVTKPAIPGATIRYSESGEENSFIYSEPPVYTDVGDYTVWYRIEATNYEAIVGSTNLVINRRPITLTSAGLTNYYDGAQYSTKDLGTNGIWTTSVLGLAQGDYFDTNLTYTTKVLTNVCTIGNAYVYQITNNTYSGRDLALNYYVTTDWGELKMNPVELRLTVTVNDRAYDGTTNATFASAEITTNTWNHGAIPEGQSLKFLNESVSNYFDTADVGVNKTVSMFGFRRSLVVTDAPGMIRSNYRVATNIVNRATIYKAGPPPIDPDPEGDFPPEAGPWYEDPNTNPPSPEDEQGNLRKLSNYDIVTVYDGEGHTFDYAALTNSIATNDWVYAGYKVTYSFDGKKWSDDIADFTFTDVTETPTSFWYNVEAPFGTPNYSNYIHAVGVTITQRVVQVTSGSESWSYDGQAHSNMTVTVTGGSFVEGEGITSNNFNTITTVGTNDNWFTVGWLEGTKPTNYDLSVVTGKIAVLTAKMPDPDPGEEEPNDPNAGPFDGPDFDDPRVPPAKTNTAEGAWSKLSDFDVVTVYDGATHTFDVAALTNAVESLELHGNPYAFAYSLTGVADSWTNEPFAFTDVVETPTSFWYRVSVPNYTNYIHAVGVVVTQRVVQVASGSETWRYNGLAHSNMTVTVTNGTFVAGEGITSNDFSTITNVGTNDNGFTVGWLPNTKASNYDFSVVTGKIAVVAKSPEDGDIALGEMPGPLYYNADAKTPRPGVTDKIGDKTVYLVEGIDFDYAWFDNTNATEHAWMVVTFKGNYTGSLAADFAILPRAVTLTSGTETWVYDGKPHTNETVTATAYNDDGTPGVGFVTGEGVWTNGFPVVTAVTNDMPNTFAWGWLANTLATNYTVSVTTGLLTVVKAATPPLDPENPEHPFPPEAGPFDEDPNTNPPSPEDPVSGDLRKLSNYDIVTVYDGEGHTFDYAALTNSIATNDWVYAGYKVTYSFDGKKWSDDIADFTFTDVTETPTSFWYNVEAPFGTPNYSNYIHAVGVTITQRVVQVTSGSESWSYDGQAHSNMTVTVTGGSFVEGEGITSNNFNTITTVGTNDNWFTVGWLEGTKPTNYDLSVVTGKIAVLTAKMPDPDHEPTPGPDYPPEAGPFPGPYFPDPVDPPAPTNNTDGTWQKFSNYDVVTVYDGQGHTFDTNALWTTLNGMKATVFFGNEPTVTYSLTGEEGTWGSDPYFFTDVTETPTSFWYQVEVANFTNYIHVASVIITQRVVQVTSGSESWSYDGQAHSNMTVTVTGGSFVEGEGITSNNFNTITTVGTNDNWFTVGWLANTKPTNYDLSVVTGKIAVLTAKMPDPDHEPTPGPDYPPEAGPFPGPYFPDPVDPPAPTNNTDGTWQKLSNYDVVTVYDGQGHTFDTNALWTTLNGMKATAFFGNEPTVTYSLTGEEGTWGGDPYFFTDVTETPTSFWYQVEVANFTNYIHVASVIITQRVVQVTSGSESWSYDGQAHSNMTVTVTGGSFVEGEGITSNNFNTITTVGTNDNWFTVGWLDGTKPTNYDLSVVTGKIAVLTAKMPDPDHEPTPGPDYPPEAGPFPGPYFPDPVDPPAPTNNTDGTWQKLSNYDVVTVYDGAAHTFDTNALWTTLNGMKATAFFGNEPTVTYSLTGEEGTWGGDPYFFTDVTETPTSFWYQVEVANFTNYIHVASVIITQRVVQVTSGSESWSYDGQAHSNMTVSVTGGSFVGGEGITSNNFNAITTVGTNDNWFTVGWLDGTKPTNYDISVVTGKIAVLTAKMPDPDHEPTPGPDYPPEAGPFPGPYFPDPVDPPAPTNNTDGTWQKLSNYDVVTVYDGAAHTFDTNALWTTLNGMKATAFFGNEPTVTYSLTGEEGTWGGDPYFFTDVTETPTSFWYQVEVANFTNYIHVASVIITQRVVQVTSGSESWSYDGQAHSNMTVTVTGGSFVEGEGITSNNFNTITTVGTNDNWFTVGWLANTKPTNYDLSVVTGKIAVLTAKMPDPDHEPTPGPDYPPEAGPFPGPYFPDPVDPPAPTNNTDGTWQKLSNYDVVTVYDGAAHTFDTNALWTTLNGMKATAFFGNEPTVTYSLTGEEGTWGGDPYFFTDVTETPTSFWYQVEVANFTNYIHVASVIITNRPVTITFTASNKVYDGNTNATCSGISFANVVTNESFTLNTSGMTFAFEDADIGENKKVTAYGYDEANVVAGENTTKDNYTFIFVPTNYADITTKQITFTVSVDPEEFGWDGAEHFPTNIVVTDGATTLVKGRDYTYTEKKERDIGAYTISVTGKGNYAGSSGQAKFWITAHTVETWIEDVCQGVETNGTVLSGNDVSIDCPPIDGYCLDWQNSVTNGTVRRVDDPDGLLRLVRRYEKDSNEDDVPDKYQRRFTFRVVNGWWNDDPSEETGGSAPITLWVTKLGSDGLWNVNGSNTLSAADIPAAGLRPFGAAFAQQGDWWPVTPEPGMWVGNATNPLFLFAYRRVRGGGSLRGRTGTLPTEFKGVADVATFEYKDGKAVFKVNESAYVNGSLIVSMPLELTQVTISGATSLDAPIVWEPLATKRTDMSGYVTIDTGAYRFFKIDVK